MLHWKRDAQFFFFHWILFLDNDLCLWIINGNLFKYQTGTSHFFSGWYDCCYWWEQNSGTRRSWSSWNWHCHWEAGFVCCGCWDKSSKGILLLSFSLFLLSNCSSFDKVNILKLFVRKYPILMNVWSIMLKQPYRTETTFFLICLLFSFAYALF